MDSKRFAATAEMFEGTPFASHGREPGVWLDCVGLVVCSLEAIGIRCEDERYALTRGFDGWERLLQALAKVFEPVVGDWRRGDVLAIRYHGMPNHLAIYLGNDMMIHAYSHPAVSKVIRTPMDYALKKRVRSVWRLRG